MKNVSSTIYSRFGYNEPMCVNDLTIQVIIMTMRGVIDQDQVREARGFGKEPHAL